MIWSTDDHNQLRRLHHPRCRATRRPGARGPAGLVLCRWLPPAPLDSQPGTGRCSSPGVGMPFAAPLRIDSQPRQAICFPNANCLPSPRQWIRNSRDPEGLITSNLRAPEKLAMVSPLSHAVLSPPFAVPFCSISQHQLRTPIAPGHAAHVCHRPPRYRKELHSSRMNYVAQVSLPAPPPEERLAHVVRIAPRTRPQPPGTFAN
jgi:hypothetical protein